MGPALVQLIMQITRLPREIAEIIQPYDTCVGYITVPLPKLYYRGFR